MPIPLLIGIFVKSYQLALRLHNEVPGIVVPDPVQARLRDAGPDAAAEGLAIARELLDEARERAAGVYLIPPFRQPLAVLESSSADSARRTRRPPLRGSCASTLHSASARAVGRESFAAVRRPNESTPHELGWNAEAAALARPASKDRGTRTRPRASTASRPSSRPNHPRTAVTDLHGPAPRTRLG